MRARLSIVELHSQRGAALLARFSGRRQQVIDAKVRRGARRLVESVRRRGDRALLAAVAKLDGLRVDSVAALRFWPQPPSAEELPDGFAAALEEAIAAVERFHRPQRVDGYVLEEGGVVLEERREALRRVGLYVPGGRAVYPSTVVMTVIPAQLAGVPEIVVTTPPAALASPALRHTLARLGVEEVWGMGGAQAIAALAYGTESIRRVDKILGPGNAWVTAAKELVCGDVATDGTAGPSEVVILASGAADPVLVAADLLAQAEHDPRAAALLVTADRGLAKAVRREVKRQLATLTTAETASSALRHFGGVLLVPDLATGREVVQRIAPEHLELVGAEPEALAAEPWFAGAVFVGGSTPEVFGDYLAGPSHVLPTCGTARFESSLGVEDFVRRYHVVRSTADAARRWAVAAANLACCEGLPAHARAAELRR